MANLCEFLKVDDLDDIVLNVGGVADKESEEKSIQRNQTRRHGLRQTFWTKTLGALRTHGVSRFDNNSHSKDHWLASTTGVSGCGYNLIFGKDLARVELYLVAHGSGRKQMVF